MNHYTITPIERLRAHEEFVEERVLELIERFRIRNSVDYAIIIDDATGVVIDGHHRYEALRRMDAHHAPVHVVDYLGDDTIIVKNWREDEPAVSKRDIIDHAMTGRLYPPKTTRHDFIHTLDPIDVPLSRLQA